MERTFTYKIKPVKSFGSDEIVDFGFTGEIIVKMPEFLERMKLAKEQQKLGEDIELVAKSAIDICTKYIVQMSVKHEDIADEITSIDDLTIFDGGVSILFDIYNRLLNGWSLSPKSVKP